jgi:transcriptional regulator with XRE-family HTH domain
MSGDDGTNRLGAYLRARRDLVPPERAGIEPGIRRRVRGLRREEVALLAGISADYYLRLERGRDKNPSPQVLEALARVLQLDDVERRYLLGLAAPRPRARPRRRPEHVPARLHHLLAAVGVPAFVEGRSFDVLAANALATAFSPRLSPGENRLRSIFI